MLKNEIGINAGIIWQFLDTKGEQSLKTLKSVLKLRDDEFYLALGWLAREGKILFFEEDNTLMLILMH